MISISTQQVSKRFDVLPEILKETAFSPHAVTVIRKIGGEQHLTEDKTLVISKIVGYTLFGFIHPEDLGKEIREALGIPSQVANSIATEINKKIFAPIRADLEKVYMPPVREAPRPTPQAEPEAVPEEALDLRTSKTPPVAGEGVKIAGPGIPALKTDTGEKPVTIPQAPLKSEEGPLIIHKEVGIKPASVETGSRSLGGLFGFLKPTRKKEDAGGVAAQIRLGKESEKPATITSKPEPMKPRIVHYTEFRTPISPFGEGQGEISKIEFSKQPRAGIKTEESGPKEVGLEPPKTSPTKEVEMSILQNEIFKRPEIEPPVPKQSEISPIIELRRAQSVPKFSPSEPPPLTIIQTPEEAKPKIEEIKRPMEPPKQVPPTVSEGEIKTGQGGATDAETIKKPKEDNDDIVVDLRTFEIKKSENN